MLCLLRREAKKSLFKSSQSRLMMGFERDQQQSCALMAVDDLQILKASLDCIAVKYFEGFGWDPIILKPRKEVDP